MRESLETGDHVAVKIELKQDGGLREEYRILKRLQGLKGIPKVYWLGEEAGYNILVMQKLSVNLEDHHKSKFVSENAKQMSMLMALDQMVVRLRDVHDRKVIHRDIKPENFMFAGGDSDDIFSINSPNDTG